MDLTPTIYHSPCLICICQYIRHFTLVMWRIDSTSFMHSTVPSVLGLLERTHVCPTWTYVCPSWTYVCPVWTYVCSTVLVLNVIFWCFFAPRGQISKNFIILLLLIITKNVTKIIFKLFDQRPKMWLSSKRLQIAL